MRPRLVCRCRLTHSVQRRLLRAAVDTVYCPLHTVYCSTRTLFHVEKSRLERAPPAPYRSSRGPCERAPFARTPFHVDESRGKRAPKARTAYVGLSSGVGSCRDCGRRASAINKKRVVAATNCPCLGFTSDSKMRPDLLARISTAGAYVPALSFREDEQDWACRPVVIVVMIVAGEVGDGDRSADQCRQFYSVGSPRDHRDSCPR